MKFLISLTFCLATWITVSLALQDQAASSSRQNPSTSSSSPSATTTTTNGGLILANNTTAKLDLIGFNPITGEAATTTLKFIGDKCNKNGSNKRCQKFREKEKLAKSIGINEIWNDADMLQHPIDEEPRRMDRALGEMCLYSSDCISGCCMLDRETKIRSCQPKSIQGEKCTTAQIKADLYVDVCPCEAGDNFCVFPGEFCSK